MPLQKCSKSGTSGWKWGNQGKCFIGTGARTRALRQGRAIEASVHNRTEIVPSNPLKADPTRTITLRKAFELEFIRRFNRLKGNIIDLIIVEDAFGLKQENRLVNPFLGNTDGTNTNGDTTELPVGSGDRDNHRETVKLPVRKREVENEQRTDNLSGGSIYRDGDGNSDNRSLLVNREPLETQEVENDLQHAGIPERDSDGNLSSLHLSNSAEEERGKAIPKEGKRISRAYVSNTRWRFQSNPQKVESFRQWLASQITADIVPLADTPDKYWERFVQEGYRKGAGRAFTDVRKPALAGNIDFFEGTRDEFLRQSFAQPVAIEKVQLLTGRVFTELKGVTDVMAQQITRELAEGLTRGDSPRKIARDLNNRVEKIGKHRARLIARTEIIKSHAEGQLDAMENLGVVSVGVAVEWSTAGDDRVCPLCQPLDGVVMKIREARGIIPRHPQCRCAFIPANIGEDKAGQKRSKEQIDTAIDKSIKAEIPKRSKRSLAEQKRLTRTPLADKTIAKKRPVSILDKPTRPPKRPKTPPKPRVPKESFADLVSEAKDVGTIDLEGAKKLSGIISKAGKSLTKPQLKKFLDELDIAGSAFGTKKQMIKVADDFVTRLGVTKEQVDLIPGGIAKLPKPTPKPKKPVVKTPTKPPSKPKIKPKPLDEPTPRKQIFSEQVQEAVSGEAKSFVKIAQEIGSTDLTKTRNELLKLVKEKKIVKVGTNFKLSGERLKTQSAWQKSLTSNEAEGIFEFTGPGFELLRDCQSGKSGPIADCQKLLKELLGFNTNTITTALDRAPQFKGTSFRGLNFKTEKERAKFIAELKKSKGMVDRALMSTSQNRTIAEDFARTGAGRFDKPRPGVLFEIRGKSGVDIAKVSSSPLEEEIVFKGGTKFKMVEIKEGTEDLIRIVLEEI